MSQHNRSNRMLVSQRGGPHLSANFGGVGTASAIIQQVQSYSKCNHTASAIIQQVQSHSKCNHTTCAIIQVQSHNKCNHTTSAIIQHVQSYNKCIIQQVRLYNKCNHTTGAIIQQVQSYNKCNHTTSAIIQQVQSYTKCKHTTSAIIQQVQHDITKPYVMQSSCQSKPCATGHNGPLSHAIQLSGKAVELWLYLYMDVVVGLMQGWREPYVCYSTYSSFAIHRKCR